MESVNHLDIYTRAMPAMTKYITIRYDLKKEDAEDIFHEAYLSLLKWKHYNEIRDFEPYLMGTVMNQVKSFFRKRGQMLFIDTMPEIPYFDDKEASFKIIKADIKMNLLDKLTPENKEIFVQRFILKKTLREIAELTGKSINNVHTHLVEWKKKLKRFLVNKNLEYDYDLEKEKVFEYLNNNPSRRNTVYNEVYIDKVYNKLTYRQISEKYNLTIVHARNIVYFVSRKIKKNVGSC